MSTDNRLKQITEFVKKAIGGYSAISRKIEVNDCSDVDYTDYSVEISYRWGDTVCAILRISDEEEPQVLKGEDFYFTDERDFLITLLLISLEHNKE